MFASTVKKLYTAHDRSGKKVGFIFSQDYEKEDGTIAFRLYTNLDDSSLWVDTVTAQYITDYVTLVSRNFRGYRFIIHTGQSEDIQKIELTNHSVLVMAEGNQTYALLNTDSIAMNSDEWYLPYSDTYTGLYHTLPDNVISTAVDYLLSH
jgi:hypothetical protein